jgi:ATP-dependent RNA helicase RhlB
VPLDPESYVHRIGRTARAGKAGKAVTLACEKFVYGLPAIEKYIGARIPSLPFGEELLAEDKSSGMRFAHRHEEGRRDRGSSNRDHGRGGLDRSGRGRRPERPAARPAQRGGQGGQESHGDRKPKPGMSSIQRSIAEAAGRALSAGPEEIKASERKPRPDQGAQRGRDGQNRPKQGEIRQNRSDAPGRNEGGRKDGDRRDRPADRRDRPARPAEAAAGSNPYDMPMEERMKLYRQRYGESGGQARGGQAGQAPRKREDKPRGEGKSDSRGQRPQGGRAGDAQRGKDVQGERKGRDPGKPLDAGKKAEPKKPGLVDRLKSIFGGKKKK